MDMPGYLEKDQSRMKPNIKRPLLPTKDDEHRFEDYTRETI